MRSNAKKAIGDVMQEYTSPSLPDDIERPLQKGACCKDLIDSRLEEIIHA